MSDADGTTLPEAAPPGPAYVPTGARAGERAGAPAGDAPERRRLVRALREAPTSFGFFQMVRLLRRLRPDRAPVGGWNDPADEFARFTVPPSLGFPPNEVASLDLPDASEQEPARLAVLFMGLTGPQGVLPHAYTEHAATRARARDTAFRDFLDLFHHRALSLFYRAWERARFAIAAESRGEDRLYDHLLDLAGLGAPALRKRLPVPDQALAYYAGLLAQRGRPADGLARLVRDYFDVDAHVEQFVGAWRRVGGNGQCTVGAEDDAGRLGWGVLGDEAWDPHARVRLRLGPLTRAQYDAFLPGGDAHAALAALCRLYADEMVEVEAQLVLSRDEVPRCILGSDARAGAPTLGGPAPPALGRGTWLAARPLTRDPDETLLALT